MRTRDMKHHIVKYVDEYDNAMLYELTQQLKDYVTAENSVEDIDPEEIFNLVDRWKDNTPDPYDWALDQVTNEMEDVADQQYQQMKDER